MLKKLNTIKDAVSLAKADQVTLNGGLVPTPIGGECSVVCVNAPGGTPCFAGGPHCPGECNGRGGWAVY